LQLCAIEALGRTRDPEVLACLDDLVLSTSPTIRLKVVHAFIDALSQIPVAEWTSVEARGLLHLLDLMSDVSPKVRDWATFGVGSQLDIDGQVVRDALAKALFDEDEHTRLEAVMGLARRRDHRARPAVLAALDQDEVPDEIFEAAAYVASPEIFMALDRHDAGSTAAERARSMSDPREQIRRDQILSDFIEQMAQHPDADHFSIVCHLFESSVNIDEKGSTMTIDYEHLLDSVEGNIEKAVAKVFEG